MDNNGCWSIRVLEYLTAGCLLAAHLVSIIVMKVVPGPQRQHIRCSITRCNNWNLLAWTQIIFRTPNIIRIVFSYPTAN